MKELDFDELDKAVNSLMAGVAGDDTAKPAKENDDETVTIDSALSDDTKPDFSKVDAVAAEAVDAPVASPKLQARPSLKPALATRRGGRVMDVVHPSTDGKPVVSPVRPVSRQGVTIAPSSVSENAKPDTAPVNTDQLKVGDSSADTKPEEVNSSASESTAQAAPVADWPDPLDLAVFKEPDTVPTQTNKTSSIESPAELVNEAAAISEAEPEAPAPLTSPFLSDAKVEKRPLGGLTPATEEASDAEPKEDTADRISQHDPEDQLPANPEKIDMPLPEELRSDLMAIESGTHLQVSEDKNVADVQSLIKEIKQDDVAKSTPVPPSKEEEPVPTPPTGPTSIAQQYKEAPSTGDQSTGAIYDTDTYHQPLKHPAEKKTGWLWVVWIVAILLVGAGGGAALYFLGLL